MKHVTRPFDLVIFDCDGVLVDSEPLSLEAFENVYAREGMVLPAGTVAQGIGMKQADIINLIENLTGHRLPDTAEPSIWPETRALFAEKLVATTDIAGFLDQVSAARCVASSSSPERLKFSLGVTKLDRYFGDAVFSSSMVKRGKPAPDLFLFAADKMGIDPSRCVVIEDSPYGVEGAVAAGMVALGFTGGSHTYVGHAEKLSASGAEAVYDNWTDIAARVLG